MQKPPCVRQLDDAEAAEALELYSELTAGPPCMRAEAFGALLSHPGMRVFGAEASGGLLGMATLHVLPNVTRGARPYGLIGNVVTRQANRGQGIGRGVIQAAIDAAWQAKAYKIMLITGQSLGAKGFYEALGFSDTDKVAMVMRM